MVMKLHQNSKAKIIIFGGFSIWGISREIVPTIFYGILEHCDLWLSLENGETRPFGVFTNLKLIPDTSPY